MRVLVVEDEPTLAVALEEGLRVHGFEPLMTRSAEQAWERALEVPFDVALLDVMLPEGDDAGFRLATDLRESGFQQPILFLTAREALPDRVHGLEIGEDYLAKPFALVELVARLRALFRRGDVRPRKVEWGALQLFPDQRRIVLEGALVRLTGKEYEVLEFLMLNPGRVFTRAEILERIWGLGFESNSNLLDVYVSNVRRKIGEGIIETVRGLGYRFPG